MGLDSNGAKFLLYARSQGVDFRRTATIGRQRLQLRPQDLGEVFRDFAATSSDEEMNQILTDADGYAEPLFSRLGAQEVHSFDASDYEGATHRWDMNLEVPDSATEQYTTVIDGGSLEHVFNFPTAIRNCMEMVRVGGHFIGLTPANNFMGHGFYQFSPELFYSVFTRANGFELIRMVALEDRRRARWYSVSSPAEVGRRVKLLSSRRIYLFILAKRVARAEIFGRTPQQSDYLAAWGRGDAPASKGAGKRNKSSPWKRLRGGVPSAVREAVRNLIPRPTTFDPAFFHPFDPAPPADR